MYVVYDEWCRIQNKKDLLNTQRQIRDNKRREQLEKRKAGRWLLGPIEW